MRLSLLTDYALRSLIFLAGNPGRRQISQVADFFRISKDHVAKSVQLLSRHGYVRSIRGIGGGIELAREASEISVGEVILACEGNMHLLECVDPKSQGVCVIQPHCRLKGVLAEAERIQLAYLAGVRLSDLAAPSAECVPLEAIGRSPAVSH